jgi:hypothetical protein
MALTQVSRGLLSTSIDDNGNATAITIDSSENVGIGTTAPERLLHVNSAGVQVGAVIQSTSTLSSRLSLMDANTTSSAKVGIGATGDTLGLYAGGSVRATVDASGNVGIGTSNPLRGLDLRTAASGFGNVFLVDTTSGTTGTGGGVIFGSDDGQGTDVSVAAIQGIKENSTAGNQQGALLFTTKNSIAQNLERMRIDSSGNLLVGKTSLNTNTAGLQLESDGYLSACRDGGNVVLVNRKSSDGALVTLQKDGATVGSIGNRSTALFIDASISSGAGLDLTQLAILPRKDGALNNGDISLGEGGYRYKNMFLSGGVFLGGTGSANKLDDYEEGTWTPTIGAGTISSNYTRYIKVGNKVTVAGFIHTFSDRTSSSAVAIGGLPFVSNSQAVAVGATLSRYINAGTGGDPVMYTAVGNTVLHPYVMTKAGNYGNVLHSDLHNSSANMYFSITYEV